MQENMKGLDLEYLTTVFPRHGDSDAYVVMPHFKRLGLGAFRNGVAVPEKQESETKE